MLFQKEEKGKSCKDIIQVSISKRWEILYLLKLAEFIFIHLDSLKMVHCFSGEFLLDCFSRTKLNKTEEITVHLYAHFSHTCVALYLQQEENGCFFTSRLSQHTFESSLLESRGNDVILISNCFIIITPAFCHMYFQIPIDVSSGTIVLSWLSSE